MDPGWPLRLRGRGARGPQKVPAWPCREDDQALPALLPGCRPRLPGLRVRLLPKLCGGVLQNVGGGAGGTQDGDLPVPGSWNVDVGTGAHAAPERQEESDIETFLEAG